MNKPLISIIVPTYNSESNLMRFLKSCREQSIKDFEIIINDDPRTSDRTLNVIESYMGELNIKYINSNISMAQGRLEGARVSNSSILLHLDSDMELSRNLVKECLSLVPAKYDALVIPEESVGTTFWAKCKRLEKKCYDNNDMIESVRCMTKESYYASGAHNPDMIFSEDKDLDIRIRSVGYRIGRTESMIFHNEGELKLIKTLRKKLIYSNTANLFSAAHPQHFKWQSNPINRYILFAKNYEYFFKEPLVYIGLYYMKTLEYMFSFIGLMKSKRS